MRFSEFDIYVHLENITKYKYFKNYENISKHI